MRLKSERELDTIRGKLLISGNKGFVATHAASQKEINDFLFFVGELEQLLDEADLDDYFGTEGWRHRLGID